MTDRYLIVGLGNPGREYERTRHNIGFRVVDEFAAQHGLSFSKKQGRALVAEGTVADRRVIVAKPMTYMNLSGEAVRSITDFYKLPTSAILIVMDDLDLPLGTLRLREKGSAGGQNGMKHILQQLGTQEIARLRFGIGRPPGRMEAREYVLQPFAKEDEILVIETVGRATKAIETWLKFGIALAMTRHNGTAEEAARNATAQPTAEAISRPTAAPAPEPSAE